MVNENPLPPFWLWLPGAIVHWLAVVAGVGALALLAAWLVLALSYGPGRAGSIVGRALAAAVEDLGRMSWRRIMALAGLAVKESIRRRVVVVFAVFLVLLLFAGWFLDPGSPDPARLYISFVLTATSYLVLLLALFLSAFSLPADIKNRTISTVVTKPVRSSEIVLGRLLGFSAVGTLLLAMMGLMSYLFVVRGLGHTHQVALGDLTPDSFGPAAHGGGDGPAPGWKGRTRPEQHHRHEIYVDPSGRARVELQNGHSHELSVDPALLAGPQRAKAVVQTGPPEGLLVARVPIYGKLRFHDRAGNEAEQGISVGNEWTYRSYIAGGTLAAAIWTFENITEKEFPRGLPLEMTTKVFRTYKGDIVSGIPATLSLRNPRTGLKIEAKVFPAKEFLPDRQFIPRKLQAPAGRTLDLFRDLVSDDGRVEIWLQCGQPEQFFGAAQPDLYIRARDNSFAWNFAKSYLGIWLQMELLLAFGVMFSTFLSGPIAMIATLAALLGGLCMELMTGVASHQIVGGGPAEAFIRLLTQDNVVSDLEPGLRTTAAKMFDTVAEHALAGMASVLPDFGRFNYAQYVAYGFDITGNMVLIGVLSTAGFLLPIFVAGYFFLKTREVAG